MSFHIRIGKRIFKEILTKGPKKLKEVNEDLTEVVEFGRKFLPLSRGGTGFADGRDPIPAHSPSIPSAPPLTGDAVRFKPQQITPTKVTKVTRREEDVLQNELQNMFDQLPTEGQQELAYLTLRENNQMGEQDQTLENALARLGADRPKQFQARGRSNQFSRLNLVPMPKKKRKVSAYSKRFGIELKKLKKLHPRTKIQNLMAKAHRRTRAAMKKK